ncbi:MAG: FAD-dependent oxidoreductase [Verrucomicrobia bacterium]|nr:FAD-dependent oxidoreductase [Verrucomicrobiota bacterium]MCG2679231.1 FAD-dependent oxidoreductase [Kiritimatiellia bacterium]MBU4248625.1 FAD-dependent oxidoreductase [Verrucomicrobiota bacterium]MBU4290086.1 FAD-dependent oxidoreductase [Verrucomicrobiota bacterium]MBU4428346.1 FAD-dependent oxidoreductase [Verrucomicrobiota bacterium]
MANFAIGSLLPDMHDSGGEFPCEELYDVVVYGGTSAGVVAAVQTARTGKRVVLIESGRHLGGLSSGGLGATDIGNKQAIGGMAREFYHRIFRYYQKPDAWKYGTREEYLAAGARRWDAEQAWWMFEPHAAERVFNDMLREAKVPVVYGERLDLMNGVRKQGLRIAAIVMESGRVFGASMFIDATYEGDLMAKAGVSYTVGRESNVCCGETLNGVQPHREHERYACHHQFLKPVDPYIRSGDPAGGLLPGIHDGGPGREGEGDRRIQAYCFRTCLTDQTDNMVPVMKPKNYNPLRYELLLRYFEAGFDQLPVDAIAARMSAGLPNRKTDNNNIHAVSVDNTGLNHDYPDGDYVLREEIIRDHVCYQQGLYWTLANHPRVPDKIRSDMRRWGLAKDEFTDTDNWPHQLYVREARRMVADYVMTETDCLGRCTVPDSIGLGAYGMDSHNTQRYVDETGHVRNEGNVQTEGNFEFVPYPISYRSIVPKATQCSNLLVPVCLSASHIAYGSIRMEPVFMVLGQSAALAAVEAIDDGCEVQAIAYARLRARLLRERQVLESDVRISP